MEITLPIQRHHWPQPAIVAHRGALVFLVSQIDQSRESAVQFQKDIKALVERQAAKQRQGGQGSGDK